MALVIVPAVEVTVAVATAVAVLVAVAKAEEATVKEVVAGGTRPSEPSQVRI